MRLISIPANPVPDDAATAMLQTPDGASCCAMPGGRRRPAARARCALFQGRAEFIEKYFEVVRDLRASRLCGHATFDWRGQGLSERALNDRYRGHVTSFADYATDLETFMKEVVLPDCPPPLFALAHSMGAAVLIQSAARGHRWFDRMVLTAPMLRLTNRRMLGAAPFAARDATLHGTRLRLHSGRQPDRAVDAAVRRQSAHQRSGALRSRPGGARVQAEPTLGIGSPTVAWIDSAFRVMRQMRVRPRFPRASASRC